MKVSYMDINSTHYNDVADLVVMKRILQSRLSKVRSLIRHWKFVWLNCRYAYRVAKISRCEKSECIICGVGPLALGDAIALYRTLNGGKSISLSSRIVYYLFGRRWCLGCYEADTNRLIAVAFFYRNSRDIEENTVHVGFTGVVRAYRGRGLARKLLECALSNFETGGFSGVSLRVSADNTAAIQTYKKVGFEIIEGYYDSVMKVHRFYMVKSFDSNLR